MLFPPDSPWIRRIGWVRVLLAAIALGLSYVEPASSPRIFRILSGVFLGYGVLVALRMQALRGTLGLLALFGDTVYFLILAGFGPDHMLWMAAAYLLYLLTEALVFYTLIEVAMIAGVCAIFGAVLPQGPIRALEPTVVVAGIFACCFASAQQRQSRRIDALQEKLTQTEQAAQTARDSERQRIASDFHDGPLQSFISLQMRLEILRKVMERDFKAGMEDLRELQGIAISQIRDLRAFLHSMRPADTDSANLVATARRTAEAFQKETGIPVTFLGATVPLDLSQESTLEVLQMLRESLHNVQKHAGATRVAVAIEKAERALELSIDDNGHGFTFAGAYTLDELELLKLGPASLKRRARTLNADLVLESRPGRGAGLKFRIPLQ